MWNLRSDPWLDYAFSVNQVGSFTYVGSSHDGLWYRRRWHWWQSGWWRNLFQGNEASTASQMPGQEPHETVPEGMVWVPAGEFEMNQVLDAPFVYLDGYFIDRLEVTWQEYCTQLKPADCNKLSFEERQLPVADIDLSEAEAYCQAVGKRLPLETEWQKAATGVDGRLLPWGDEMPVRNNLSNLGTGKPVVPGSYLFGQSPYGAQDVIGNVAEITLDTQPQSYTIQGGSAGDTNIADVLFLPGGISIPTFTVGFRCVQSQAAAIDKNP